MSKALIAVDFETKEVMVLQEGSKSAGTPAVALNATTGETYTPSGDLAEWIAHLQGKTITPRTEQPGYSTSGSANPQKLPFIAGKHYDFVVGKDPSPKYQFDRGGATGAIAVHFQIPEGGKGVTVKLIGGGQSGDVTGEAQSSIGARDKKGDEATTMGPGQLNSFSVRGGKAGEYVNVFLTVTGGDPSFVLEALPL